MTAIDPESQQPDKTHSIIAALPAVNLNIFAVELSSWAISGVKQSLDLALTGFNTALNAIEKSKRSIISPLLPRDSRLGRPFSPLGAGGLSAVIGLSGAVIGPNSSIPLLGASTQTYTPSINNQIVVAGSVLSSDIMIDNSKLKTVIPEGRTRDEVVIHAVEGGETLESIAKEYKVTVDSIKYVNDMGNDDVIVPGQELTILPVSGVLHEVVENETVETIAQKWEVPAQAIVDINWLDEPYQVHKGQKLVIPNADIPKPIEPEIVAPPPVYAATQPQTQRQPVAAGSKFYFPVSGQITQYFSYYHNGLDIGTMTSTPPIWSAESGVVTFAGWWNGGGGYSVWVDHGNGFVTQYAHMSRISVSVGQAVGRGQQLGNTGNTGLSFGNHLHFTVLQNGQPINPLSVL